MKFIPSNKKDTSRRVKRWMIVAVDKETGKLHKAPYRFKTQDDAQEALDKMSIPSIAKNFMRKIRMQEWRAEGNKFDVCVKLVEEPVVALF